MIQYFFSFDRQNHLIFVEIHFENLSSSSLKLHLPAWRPGRYQLQNFAKNILSFKANSSGETLSWKKISTNVWEINTKKHSTAKISYAYYANELNAGSSLINNEIIYVNPVNVCMFENPNQSLEVNVLCDEPLDFACGLKHEKTNEGLVIFAEDYHAFFDSPFIISSKIEHHTFTACEIPFHFWIQGSYTLNIQEYLKDLKKVTEYQIRLFGEFPEPDYHFLLIIPYTSYYHGVEHRNSTVMVLGEQGVLTQNAYNDLLGLASHELFHAWNIAKIRPKELLPYDYTRENYFETCFVAEGFTTYFGDRTLLDSGVFNLEQYRHELETTFRRHFEENDHSCQSLLESSFDLWVDGYEKGTPNKKVSVYNKGAIATLILNVLIKTRFPESKSMETVMQKLFHEFGDLKNGYTYNDIKRICEEVYEGDLSHFFATVIEGNEPILSMTQKAVNTLGWRLEKEAEFIHLSM